MLGVSTVVGLGADAVRVIGGEDWIENEHRESR